MEPLGAGPRGARRTGPLGAGPRGARHTEPLGAEPQEARHVGPLGAAGQPVRARERVGIGQGAPRVGALRVTRQEPGTSVSVVEGRRAYGAMGRSVPSIEMACTLTVESAAGVRL
jgi:hypothetical protein